MFRLDKLLEFDNIVIQCHDNPDADTLACGYALYDYLTFHQKSPKLIYAGPRQITKANLLLMVHTLAIPIEYVTTLSKPQLLITVDCQYQQSNVQFFPAENIASVDHHVCIDCQTEWMDIRPNLGSCSTLVWALLKEANYNFELNLNVSTALYYGLLTDTNGFQEIFHPLDRELCETISYDRALITRYKNSNISLEDLEIAGTSLLRYSLNETDHFALFKSQSCDPNILGFISDLAIQVDSIDTCIVYAQLSNFIKYSIRSCIPEVKANELALYIAGDIGSGGGHKDKAGGSISLDAFHTRPHYRNKYSNIEEYFLAATKEYFTSFDIIYSDQIPLYLKDMALYRRRESPIGFVLSTDILKENTPFVLHTLDSDIEGVASSSLYILLDCKGSICCIPKDIFIKAYKPLLSPYIKQFDYPPHIKNLANNKIILLDHYLHECVPLLTTQVYAKKLTRKIKLFRSYDPDEYSLGFINDYIVVAREDPKDIFILKEEVFLKTYIPISNHS